MNLQHLMAVGIGGAIGSGARYLIGLSLESTSTLATLSVNIIGSFLLGAILAYFIKHPEKSFFHLLLGVGFCGGFTTMSTVALDLFTLIQGEQFLYLTTYFSATLIGGVIAAIIGFAWIEKKVTK